MHRSLALTMLVFFALPACGGGGSHLANNSPSGGSGSVPTSGKRNVGITLAIPATGASSSSLVRRPKTLSSSSESVTVSVNGGAAQIFNLSGSSCTSNDGAETCTFSVGASYGLDTFLILTYSGTNGSGTALNAAAETIDVTQAGPNSFSATAGNIAYVTTNADSGAGSLRAAITAAVSGITTAVLFQDVTGTITLASPITIAQNVAIIGPGASTLSIGGGGATSLFTVSTGVNAVIYGLTLTQGNSSTSGGAIFSDGMLSIFSSTFTSNAAGIRGGAIEVDEGALIATGCTFTSNTASNGSGSSSIGGAVDSFGDVTIDSSTFKNNSATNSFGAYGGAIAEEDFNSTGLTISNTQFIGNVTGSTSTQQAQGGAIYDNSGDTLEIFGDTFGGSGAGNTVTSTSSSIGGAIDFGGGGGGIVDNGIGGNVFANNSVQSPSGGGAYGGAIYTASGVIAFTGPNNAFSGNTAAAGANVAGGAIADYSGGVLYTGTTSFTSNSAKTTDASDSGAFGGAIEYYYFPVCETSVARRPAPSHSSGSGGMLVAPRTQPFSQRRMARVHAASSRRVASIPTTSTISGAFTSNTVGPSASYGSAGGGIDIEQQTGSGAPFAFTSATFTSNSAVGTGFSADGGAISIFSGTVTIASSQIGAEGSGNQAVTRGGGIIASFNGPAYSECGGRLYPGVLTVVNSTIIGNSLSAANQTFFGGGGIANGSSVLSVSSSTIAFNSVTSNNSGGGGIFAVGGGGPATTTILNSTLFANTSSNFGGGMMNGYSGAPSTIAIANGTAYQNTATSGGNIYNADGDGSNVIVAQNSLAAGGSASSGTDIWNLDTFTSLGYNLIQQSSNYGSGTSNAPQTGDLIGQSPALASSLGDNGGPTPTLADTASSPGKGHIPFVGGLCNGAAATNVDQRGFSRGSGGVCDVGAYEFGGVSP